jgi:glutamine amidotransferase
LRTIILDLGLNNLNSVKKAFAENSTQNDSIEVISEYIHLTSPALLILPGLGKFAAAMAEIREKRFDILINENRVLNGCMVGICLGMQLLMSGSEESPGVKGLSLIAGTVRRLKPNSEERIPNIGWNCTVVKDAASLFPSLGEEKDFYFVHSYVVEARDEKNVLATSPYGTSFFTSAIIENRIIGFQFHPEKSSSAGATLIREILEWAKREI